MRRTHVLPLALLWVLTIAVFWEGLAGQFVWDDFSLIVNNTTLRDPSRLAELLTTGFWNISSSKAEMSETYTQVYRPLVTFALFLQHELFGLDPHGFHVVSLVLHLAIVTLVFGLLHRQAAGRPGALLGAVAGAALFAIHPSRTESVGWISGSTELWMGLLILAGYASWIARPRWIGLTSLLFGLALFAKETAIMVPVVLWVDMYARRGSIDWRRWGATTAIFAMFVVARFAMMAPPTGAGTSFQEMPRRVLGSLGHYIEATVWPWRPFVERGFRYTDCSGSLVIPNHTLVIGGLALLSLVALFARFRSLRGKPFAADIAWYFLFLVPVLNIWDLRAYGLTADRFLYVPLFGVCALLARGICQAWEGGRVWRNAAALGLAVLLAACAFSTREHVSHFRDSQTLWHYEAERNPANLHALELVGIQESGRRPTEAISFFRRGYERAIQHCNTALGARFALLSARNLAAATADTNQERLLALREFYENAAATNRLELQLPDITLQMTLPPGYAEKTLEDASLMGIPHAAVTMRTLDLAGAEGIVERVLENDPDHEGAWLLLVRIHARQGRYDDAERALDNARERAPGNPAIDALDQTLGQVRELASERVDDVRRQRIREAQINVMLGAPEAARRTLQPELDRTPADPLIVLAYVRTMIADGRFDVADAVIDNAERIAPQHADKWQRLRDALPRP